MVLAYLALDPTPPKKLVLATGGPQSAYEALGRRYREALAPYGIDVELRNSAGSGENLALLQREDSDVDMAFMQGGTYQRPPGEDENDPGLVSLGSLFYEPVWLFYREDSAKRLLGRPRLGALNELKGWKLNAGAPGSGVKLLAERLLELNSVALADLHLGHLANTPAVVELLEGRIDAMVFVSASDSPLIQMLLMTPGMRLFSFSQAEAYSRKLPYLSAVTLPRAVVDLGRDLPGEDVRLVAPTATLAAREGVHPALVQLMMQAADRIHGAPGLVCAPRRIPQCGKRRPAACRRGEALFQERHALAAALPAVLGVEPDRSHVGGAGVDHRGAHSVVATGAAALSTACALAGVPLVRPPARRGGGRGRGRAPIAAALLEELDRVEARAARISVPLSYADELYALRQHIDLVRTRVKGETPNTAAPTSASDARLPAARLSRNSTQRA